MAKIVSMGHYHPENIIKNQFFDELDIGSSATWIEEKTGIKERRSVLNQEELLELKNIGFNQWYNEFHKEHHSLSYQASKAWENLSQNNPELSRKNPELVICGTSVPDFDIPANACTISNRLGWGQSPSFDLNSACSSFVVDLHVASNLIRTNAYNSVAIFNPERYSLRLNYNERGSCILFGDGSSAALVCNPKTANAPGFNILDVQVMSNPQKWDSVKIPINECFSQNGSAVQKFAVTHTLHSTKSILAKNNLNISDLSYFVAHQANLRMLQSVVEKLDLSPEKHLHNIEYFGNQGAAGAPAVLSSNWDRFKDGDLVVVTVVGSGLTWGSALLRFEA